MHLQLRSRAARQARLIGGIVGAAVLLTGGGTLAATSQHQPQATPSGVTMDQAEAFVGVTPTRILDTRQVGSTKFNPGETRTLSLGAYVPPEATSVALAIVSPTGATSLGYFTMWPTGQQRPETSVLNPAPPYDLATSVLLRLGSGQGINVYNAFGQADLVVDVLGYFVPLSSVEGLGGGGDGSDFLVGSGAPASTLGNDGDVYYDTVNKIFYGPKDNGDWGDGSSAVGPAGPQGAVGPAGVAGSKILSGTGAPTAGTGANGDLYIDTASGTLYGPKTGGAWGGGTSLVGPAGPTGATGPEGPAGPTGLTGTMGPGIQGYGSGFGVVVVLEDVPVAFPSSTTYGIAPPAYAPATGAFTLDAGTYRVSYIVEATAAVGAGTELRLNGTDVVPGSSAGGGLLSLSTLSGQALITADDGDVLQLFFGGVLGATLINNASIIVEKVA